MAAPGCIFHRTLTRSRSGPNQAPVTSPVVCRESLYVLDVQRYTRDQGSSVYFPQAVLSGDDLYDITLTDGDCRLRVTLDPGLNRLVERKALQKGSTLRNTTFAPAMAAQLPACTGASGERESYRLVRLEVTDEEGGVRSSDQDWSALPWFGLADPEGPLLPLRANRSVFLPLWNNVDYSGEAWREAPPTREETGQEEDQEEAEEEPEEEGQRPAVTVSELRESFLCGFRGIARGTVHHQLIVRIINKSHLMYYGKKDRNCDCPYKAVLEVCDRTGSVCVVLWNSMCVTWYRCLKPGDIISLRRYRVKQHYQAEEDDIEISVNSRNPAAHISVLPKSSVSPEFLPPAPTYSFCNRYTQTPAHIWVQTNTHTRSHTHSPSVSKELLDRPHGAVCDVIGLLTFSGRQERIRSKDGRGAEFLQYLWLRLEDGMSSQPIMVKLFSTSQPESHLKLHPLSVLVCSKLQVIRVTGGTDAGFYLTNTTYTQVYCTGLGHHSGMSYRRLRPVQHFLQWLKSQDDAQVLNKALIGGFFTYPPPPVSLETYMKQRRGEPGFLRGAELQKELERLCYRERRTFCIQAAVTMVAYSRRGEEDPCLFWTDRASSLSPSSTSSSSPRLSKGPHLSPHLSPSPSPSHSSSSSSPTVFPLLSTPRSYRQAPSSSSSFPPTSPCSSVGQLTPRPLDCRSSRRACKRKQLLQVDTPRKRHPRVTMQPEHNNKTVILFEASMEFLETTHDDDDDDDEGEVDDDDDASSFITAPLPPAFTLVAMETLPMRYDHVHREEQANAMSMGGKAPGGRRFDVAQDDCYNVKLKALSDGVLLDTIFLPHSSSSSSLCPALLHHSNTWNAILSHGSFSAHTPPPSPADLIAMAAQLANQRLVCVLEACHLGGAKTELILSRAFSLTV